MNAKSLRFPMTAWGSLKALQRGEEPDPIETMNQLIKSYWKPVFYFLRMKGYRLHEAEDLTQEYFTLFLQKNWVQGADRKRGRFRTYLLTTLIRFLSDRGKRRAPKQHVFEGQVVSVSALTGDAERAFEPAGGQTPEAVFMRQWAKAMLEAALMQLKTWCEKRKRPEWFAMFRATHFASPEDPPTQEELAASLGQTREQVRYGLQETKREFGRTLRQLVGAQVKTEEDINREIDELMRWLR